jgi:hypothetical protein
MCRSCFIELRQTTFCNERGSVPIAERYAFGWVVREKEIVREREPREKVIVREHHDAPVIEKKTTIIKDRD